MVDFIDRHRAAYGVESICKELPIAPSTYHAAKACQADPASRSDRAKRDEALSSEIQRIFDDNFGVYGVRKVWQALKREGRVVARCTVVRLMRQLKLKGVVRGAATRTTRPAPMQALPDDHVRRRFRAVAPNRLWVADFTYVATWRGFAYTAFVIDTFADRIVGWRTSHSMKTGLVLDALEQALSARSTNDSLIHHSDRGTQYVSIRYTERLRQVGIEPSVGSTGDSYDNALAESIIGLYKTEVIHRRGPWRTLSDVEYATLEWVDWFNNRRLLSSIGYFPPAEFERAYYRKNEGQALAA